MSATESSGCDRCGRTVAPERLWTLNVNLPADGHVERRMCVVCAAELRRFLLAQPGSRHVTTEVDDSARGAESRASRLGWFVVRAVVYGGIAVGVFALVTWLS